MQLLAGPLRNVAVANATWVKLCDANSNRRSLTVVNNTKTRLWLAFYPTQPTTPPAWPASATSWPSYVLSDVMGTVLTFNVLGIPCGALWARHDYGTTAYVTLLEE